VPEQREKLRQLGIDPDNLRPSPQQVQRTQHEAMLKELHRSGVIDDDELAEKLGRLQHDVR